LFYKEKPREVLNIPKYKYFGSKETKTYHLRNCRFRKLIKDAEKKNANDDDENKDPEFLKQKLKKLMRRGIKLRKKLSH